MAIVNDSVLDRIRAMLVDAGVSFREIHHVPTCTSEAAALARGEEVKVGGKALVLKIDGAFRLFVLSAALRLDSSAVKKHFGVKRMRFATAEELMEHTGLVPGSIPPFGRPILPFDLFIDESIVANPRIAFNAGSLTDSIIFPVPDYLRLAAGTVLRFSR